MAKIDSRLRILEQARDARIEKLFDRYQRHQQAVMTPVQQEALRACSSAQREGETEIERQALVIYRNDRQLQYLMRLIDVLLVGRAQVKANSGMRWDGIP